MRGNLPASTCRPALTALFVLVLVLMPALVSCAADTSATSSTLTSPGTTAARSGGTGPAGTKDAATTAPASPKTKTVVIENSAFSPRNILLKVRDSAIWTNEDSTGHTVTAYNNAFKSKTLKAGESFTYAFDRIGAFAYYCSIHPTEKGVVRVQ